MGRRTRGVGAARTLFHLGVIGEMTDGQLVERFSGGGRGGEAAFEALVERHGGMVLRACRAILRDEHEAEDAFQATWLVMVRKAGSLWVRDSIGPWLHQVAYRAAWCARSSRLRREAIARGAAEGRRGQGGDEGVEELASALHEEIGRLPERYRDLLVLCDLEGRTHEQAARHVGCALGTVKSRLSRGRRELGDRLRRKGLTLPAPALGGWSGDRGWVSPSRALVEATWRGALEIGAGRPIVGVVSAGVGALVEVVSRSFVMKKLKGLVMATLAGAGLLAGGLAWAGMGGELEPRGEAPKAREAVDIRGRWEVLYVDGVSAGKREGFPTPGLLVPVTQETINLPGLTGDPKDPIHYLGAMRYVLDPEGATGTIDINLGGAGALDLKGVYRLKGDVLTICYAWPDGKGERPGTFASGGLSERLLVLRLDRAGRQPSARPGDPFAPTLPDLGPSTPVTLPRR